jgi:hypothetical protein
VPGEARGASPGEYQAAGEVLTAKQAPHRPGTAPALDLRAGRIAAVIPKQTGFKKETSMWLCSLHDYRQRRPSRHPACRIAHRPKVRPVLLDVLEDRTLPSFLAPVNYAVGPSPAAIVAADVNGDGELDLITANAGGNNISVQLGNGNGTFQAAQTYASGAGPVSVAVGDVNSDGKLDVVTANKGDNTVSVLLGNGDGTFQGAKNYAAGSQPVSVAVANFNGKPDIVMANQGGNTVSLLPGNGDGTFGAAQTVASFGAPAMSVAVGDFNADGKLDLAVATRGTDGYYVPGGCGYYGCYGGSYFPGSSPAVTVLLGNGNGTFTAGSSYTLPSPYEVPPSSFAPPSLAVADLIGDGKSDLVTTDAGDGLVSVLPGDGNGTFGGPTSFGAWGSPQSVAVADLNGDGKLDLVTANFGDTVSVLPGKGNGVFGIPDLFTIGSNPSSLATGDFKGDGWTDLATANANSNNVSVLINTGYWPSLLVTATDPVTGGTITSTTAGTPFHLTVTAQDPAGNVLTAFTDQVSFRSWDAQATIIDPATGSPVALQTFTYTFTAADHGTRTFTVDLKTSGTQSITVSDPTAGVTVPGAGITVNRAVASTFQVSGFPSPISASDSSTFTVTAFDAYGNVATGYSGTVILSSTDTTATFGDAATGSPLASASYTFTPADDYATHAFYATLNTVGNQKIFATDSMNATVFGSQSGIQVVPLATIAGPSTGFLNQTLTFTLGAIGEPVGTVFTYKID